MEEWDREEDTTAMTEVITEEAPGITEAMEAHILTTGEFSLKTDFLSYLLFTAIKPGFLQFFTGKKKSQYYLHIYMLEMSSVASSSPAAEEAPTPVMWTSSAVELPSRGSGM